MAQLSIVKNLYTYDHLGRLTGNCRWVNNVETETGTGKAIEYDLNGNIVSIRRGESGECNDYYFEYKGNVPVVGLKNPQTDFIELWFSMDLNGNLTSSSLGDIKVSYNFLNLPMLSSGITYTYLSDGTRLSAKTPDGECTVARGNFVYSVNPSGSITLQSVSHPEGRIYCSDTPDGEPWDCWNATDHLGNIRQVLLAGSAMPIEINDYFPFGQKIEEYSSYFKDSRRWGYAGKEYQVFGDYDSSLIDFGARYYSPILCRWTCIDPLAGKYPNSSPYAYCAGNPINYIDPTGEAWYKVDYPDGSYDIFWVDTDIVTDEQGRLYPGCYESFIEFVPGWKAFDPGDRFNIGSAVAIVYDSDSSVAFFDACTYPSDLVKYPTVPEGTYEAMQGKHNGQYPALKMFDVGKNLSCNTIELGFINPAYTDGRTYVIGANIHMAGKGNATRCESGDPVSTACFLIDYYRWDEFMSHFSKLPASSKVGIVVTR